MPQSVLDKLQYKQGDALILAAPESFAAPLAELGQRTGVRQSLRSAKPVAFVLAFVETAAALAELAPKLAARLDGDGLLWIAYPKQSSRRYESDLNRDDEAWQVLGGLGFEGVRQVAIDEDWSALRFRRAEYIGKLTRDAKRAMSATGKARVAKRSS